MIQKQELRDVIEWDVVNWGKFLKFIEMQNIQINGRRVLELGARHGGLSLYFARRGGYCVCSDLKGPTTEATELHKKYGVESRIIYEAIDATNIPEKYDGYFDIVIFKSILGGIGSYENINYEEKLAETVSKTLKPGGSILFCENMCGTDLHMYLRKRFRDHGNRWHYQSIENIDHLFSNFMLVNRDFKGFLGTFGLNEILKDLFGYIDSILFDWIVPDKYKYIGFFHYRK